MDYGPSHAQGQDDQQRTNGTGGDMPTGYRPCPFCHSVIPWESERCPSCSWWRGSIPTPTEHERQILFIASVLMVVLFVVALLIR